MFRAYFDESGHETKGFVCIAGFFGREDQWEVFDSKWRTALGQRRFLHVKDLRFKKDRDRDLLARLGPIPHACGLEAVRAAVHVSDYGDLVAGTSVEKLYNGYMSCLPVIVRHALAGTPPAEQLEAIFEETPYWRRVNSSLPALQLLPMAELRTTGGLPKLRNWRFAPKATNRIDPADYLAFALRETITHPGSQKAEWCLPIFGPNGTATPAYGLTIPRPQIRRMVERAIRFNREQGLED